MAGTDHPNIVWISLESVRHDHTSLSGYRRDTTPSLQRLADDPRGNSFEQCITHGKWTGTSTASILTGTTPPTHGIYGGSDRTLSTDISTVPELLSDAGYTTIGLSPNPNTGPAHGLNRGFDTYKWLHPSNLREVGLRTTLKYLLNTRQHGTVTRDVQSIKWAFPMNDLSKRLVGPRRSDSDPFFLYLHYNDSHHPYLPPNSFLNRFLSDSAVDTAAALELSQSTFDDIHRQLADGCPLTDEEWDALIALYDAEIAYVDHCLGRLIEAIRERTTSETIFVITGDHGDLFGEHDLIGHKFRLDDALTHVPMVTHGLAGVSHQQTNVVQHIDVMKTVLATAGVSDDQLEGVDLREDTREYAIVQRSGTNARKNLEKIREYNPDYANGAVWPGTTTAFRSDAFKYLHSPEETALYALPDEQTDVSDAHPTVAASFADYATDWLATHSADETATDETRELDPAMRDHLSDMGYLQ